MMIESAAKTVASALARNAQNVDLLN
jgi:hypothetical protein